MILRGLFLMDGSSDAPIARHLEELCSREGASVRISAPDLTRLSKPPGFSVEARLRAALELDPGHSLVFVHRDAESQPPADRVAEIQAAMKSAGGSRPCVPVIPIRMTEAWLLLDEGAIRAVAGKPYSTIGLGIPKDVEKIADPKDALRDVLVKASGASGRRLTRFKQRFPEHRRQLLERLDLDGPVTKLSAWAALVESIQSAIRALDS